MDRKKVRDRLQQSWPGLLALSGIVIGSGPWLTGSLYRNSFLGAGLTLLFLAWVAANFKNRQRLVASQRWKDQKKVMTAMAACVSVGIGMLTYYEVQMPKYKIAKIEKELYRVPPQLNKAQLRELGAECNTYGDTLCSHDVFAKIVEMDSRDYFALANLAMAQSHLGFHKYAVLNFRKAIQNGVQQYDTYKFYGHSLLATNQPALAAQAYQASLKKNPNQPSLQEKIAQITDSQ